MLKKPIFVIFPKMGKNLFHYLRVLSMRKALDGADKILNKALIRLKCDGIA